MNIFLAGSGVFGADAYRRISALRGATIVGGATPRGASADPLADLFDRARLSHVDTEFLRHRDAPRVMRDLRADLLILANVGVIVPRRVFDACRFGALCYHPSLLPAHRGRDAVKWTIALGDRVTGVTIFRPDGGIDTGPIVVQKHCRVPEGWSAGALYYGLLVPLGLDAMVEAVKRVGYGIATYTPQEDVLGIEPSYESPFPPDLDPREFRNGRDRRYLALSGIAADGRGIQTGMVFGPDPYAPPDPADVALPRCRCALPERPAERPDGAARIADTTVRTYGWQIVSQGS